MYYCPLTLDPNTAHPNLRLSEKNRVVTWSNTVQRYSDHPERFDDWLQVMCKESVSGRCYWEVEWSSEGGGSVFISVSYKGIRRKGRSNDCVFGRNSQSWSLQCSPSSLSFLHNNIQTEISGPPSSRIGVYVDHSAGTLSFYSVSHTVTLLHTVHTTFTQPLYAGFWVVCGTDDEDLAQILKEVREDHIDLSMNSSIIVRRETILQSACSALAGSYFDWREVPYVELVGEVAEDCGGPGGEVFRPQSPFTWEQQPD
ncbi:hypothetical protein NFI96_009050 [Prochilodus magdalenae]|nr:hypothetical protein NFI96_009050 [Prochilodus magdalenae]